MAADMIAFVEANADCLLRSCVPGHLTGSAWIVSPDRTRTLLTHHRKLDKWLQLGGHADGDGDLLAVARREATEAIGAAILAVRVRGGALAFGWKFRVHKTRPGREPDEVVKGRKRDR